MLRDWQKLLSAENLYNLLTKNFIWLSLFLLITALLSAHNQYDFFWDFINYHYYNAWAFWEDISAYKIVTPPALMNTYLNPLLDIPLYLLIKYFNNYAAFIYAVQGLWFGVLLFFFWKICLLFFDTKTYSSVLCVILTTLIAATGQNTWFQVGASTNEIQISVFIIGSLYFTLKYLKYPALQTSAEFFTLGLFLGTALALKQTCVSYIIAGGLGLIIMHKQLRFPQKYISLYVLGGLLGFLLFDGYFMYRNYIELDNALFPAFNELFSAKWFGTYNMIDTRYIPRGLQILYYPYIMESHAAETLFYDKRFSIFYTVFLLFALYSLFKKNKVSFMQNPLNAYLFYFTLIAYIVWISIFGIARYFIVIEMLSALFFVKIVRAIKIKQLFLLSCWISLLIITFFIFVTTPQQSIKWPKVKLATDNHFVYIEPIIIPEDMLVILVNYPIAAMIPLLAQHNKHLTVVNSAVSEYNNREVGIFADLSRQTRKSYAGDKTVIIFKEEEKILSTGTDKSFFDNSIQYEQLMALKYQMNCRKIVSNLTTHYQICFPRNAENTEQPE
jgi:hypothetical protein